MAVSGAARAVRESAGLSLAEVAAECAVTKSAVHRWETGQRAPRGEAALRYLTLLDGITGAE